MKNKIFSLLLALVMLIGFIPFTATEVQAVSVDEVTGDMTFTNGDQVRISNRTGDTFGNSAIYTASVNGGVTTWTSDNEVLFEGTGENLFHICYPATYNGSIVMLPDDQSTEEALGSADYMDAMWTGTSDQPISVELKHRFTKITVNYTFASEFENASLSKAEMWSNSGYKFFGDGTIREFGIGAKWITAYRSESENVIKAIIFPKDYTAGEDFMRVTVNGATEPLLVKMPEDITFEEGKHYTFDLKVGKDRLTIEQVSTNSTETPFGNGWNNEVVLTVGGAIGTKDVGKTAWASGDKVIATFTSPYFGEQSDALTFDGNAWSTDVYFSYTKYETPVVTAVYAPSSILGMGEYLEFDCEIKNGVINISFAEAIRDYSRLRILSNPGRTLTVTVTNFIPAGATEATTGEYNLTADGKGNAYLYGTFAVGAKATVTTSDNITVTHTFESATEHKISYVLDAHAHTYDENGSCSICGKLKVTTITFDSDGGSAVSPITQECGTAVTAPANPTKTGYNFIGWSPSLPTTMPTENMTVKAMWQAAGYTIVWKHWEGKVLETDYNVAEGTIPSYDRVFTSLADDQYVYEFTGWTPAIQPVTGDATYTATYQKVPISEYEYKAGDRVWVNARVIRYCSGCNKLKTRFTGTITRIVGVYQGMIMYEIKSDCCGYIERAIETSIEGFA